MVAGVSIEPFRGDLDELERMAQASWRDEYGEASFPDFYRPAFLRYLFDRLPEAKRDLLLAACMDGEIAAFPANLPQTFHFRGGLDKAVYSCLLVVRKEDLRRGIAFDIIRAAVERWAWINHVAFPDLSPAERTALLRAYLARVRDDGDIGTVDFTKRGWPAGPFFRARFIPYPRSVSLVSWTFNPSISPAGIPVVSEIQV